MFRSFFLLLILSLLGFSLPTQKPITIYMAGDSTMSIKTKEDHPERGWGMMLPVFFNDKVTIDNRAQNGRSTKTFRSEGLWQGILDTIQAGDYVIIQFGHNDSSPEKVGRYTTPDEYKANLIRFVKESSAKKAKPILCTPIMRRRFDEEGKFYDTHGIYPDLVREVAKNMKIPLVDMHRKSEQLLIAYQEEGSKKLFLHINPGEYVSLPDGLEDNTHFSAFGAQQMAGLFVEGITELKLKLRRYFKN
ncbi:MAG: rhamnogalacturonan acetylesterase [Saprospiraceae bacterium]